MINDQNISFARRYRIALELHLSEPAPLKPVCPTARALGQEASELGLDVLDLTRIHDQARVEIPAAVNPEMTQNSKLPKIKHTPDGIFLIESLAPIEERNVRIRLDDREALSQSEQRLEMESARYNELLTKSQRVQKQSQQLAHQILLVQEEERREISRELHDEVAQILAGINVRLAALEKIDAISFQNLKKGIRQTQKMIKESVNVVHRFAQKLRPSMLDDLGLIPALRSFIKDLPRPKDPNIKFTATKEVEKMDNLRRTVFYRVAQEALFNVVRHAKAQCATVILKEIPNGIRLEVKDDGKAFQVDQVLLSKECNRLGLLGMNERVEIVGGKFSIESVPGIGTTVRADIPFLANMKEVEK